MSTSDSAPVIASRADGEDDRFDCVFLPFLRMPGFRDCLNRLAADVDQRDICQQPPPCHVMAVACAPQAPGIGVVCESAMSGFFSRFATICVVHALAPLAVLVLAPSF